MVSNGNGQSSPGWSRKRMGQAWGGGAEPQWWESVLPVQHIPAPRISMTAAPPTYTQEVDRLPLRLTGRRGQDSAVELGVVAQRQRQADLYIVPGQTERAMQSNHI